MISAKLVFVKLLEYSGLFASFTHSARGSACQTYVELRLFALRDSPAHCDFVVASTRNRRRIHRFNVCRVNRGSVNLNDHATSVAELKVQRAPWSNQSHDRLSTNGARFGSRRRIAKGNEAVIQGRRSKGGRRGEAYKTERGGMSRGGRRHCPRHVARMTIATEQSIRVPSRGEPISKWL